MVSVGCVADFLKALKDNTDINNQYFYRGEGKNFKDTRLTASLYRRGPRGSYINDNNGLPYYVYGYKYNTWKTYLDAAMTYYRNINKLSKEDKQNFMAFCQHHGLSTPLLDISTSPLVALYFAAQSDFNDTGRVYIFKKDNFIPFDNKILSYTYLLKCHRNKIVYPLLSLHGDSDIRNALNSIKEFETNGNTQQRGYLYSVINSMIKEIVTNSHVLNSHVLPIHDSIIKELKNCNSNYSKLYHIVYNVNNGIFSVSANILAREYIKFLKIFNIQTIKFDLQKFNLNKKVIFVYGNKDIPVTSKTRVVKLEDIMNYSMLLLFLIWLGNRISNTLNPYIPQGLNFCTRCTLNWGRVKAQKSYFIIQTPFIIDGQNFGHSFSDNDLPDDNVLINKLSIIHKPEPKLIIQITHKHRILKELDALGVNKMTLFMDNDSIANYIRDRYYE